MGASDPLSGIDIGGSVRAEIFMVWLNRDRIEIAGPDGARAWTIQLEDEEHPVVAVERIVAAVVGPPLLVHSTSWRREVTSVVLSFVAVIRPEQAAGMESATIDRVELARSEANRPPPAIGASQVLEHGLRHLAWLVHDDPVVAGLLDDTWRKVLEHYVPEPFRAFA